MDRGTYIAASAGLLQLQKLAVINNNLANVNTPGFKRQFIVSTTRSFDQTLASKLNPTDPYSKGDHDRTPEVLSPKTHTDFGLGSIKFTGNPLDVALRHPTDFFLINTPEGVQYSRAGNFTLNSEGELVTPDGLPVQGDGGAINAVGGAVSISNSGDVLVDGVSVARLQVARFADTQGLEQVGGTRFRLREVAQAPETIPADLEAQSLEMSNVSAISSMIDLIAANRGFEAYTRSARTMDEMNNLAATRLGQRR